MIKIILSAILAFVVLPGVEPRMTRQPLAPQQEDEVLIGFSIKNPYNVPVYFRVRHVNGELRDWKLAPGREATYYNYDHIWIYSENASVNYRLEKEGRYVFYWDRDNEKWDLRRRR